MTVQSRFDAAYFLMWPGWGAELPGNRWHYARRLAQRVPVVLVQPTGRRAAGEGRVELEPRIPNCEILHVHEADASIQLQQFHAHARRREHRRPLLWSYNPDLLALYATAPASGRVFHATENYFDGRWYHGVGGHDFDERLRASYAISDLVIAVSAGLADSIHREAGVDPAVVTNGCDFPLYSSGGADEELVARARAFDRCAVYAGNIAQKVDMGLLVRAVTAHPATLFAFFGPVVLPAPARKEWEELLHRPNVWYGGVASLERLTDVYATADVGLIPYHLHPLFVDIAFPLKLFEMAAAGLPVVSTRMRQIEGLAPAIHIAATDEEFIACAGSVSRKGEAPEALAALVELAAANDYDAKFEEVEALLKVSVDATGPVAARDDEARALVGAESWLRSFRPRPLRNRLFDATRELVPSGARRIVPAPVKRWARSLVTPGRHA